MNVRKYRTPPCDVVLISPHTSVWIISKSCEAFVASSLGMMFFNVYLWCILHKCDATNNTSFKFMLSTMASNSLRLAMLKWSNLSCQNITPSSKEFAMCGVLAHLHIKKVQVLVPSCFCHNNSSSIINPITILVKLHFKTFENEFTHRHETILHFWNMKNLGDGCVWQFASHLHYGFDVPLANGLQNGVIAHEHLPWGNVLVRGKPLLFECHVLRCIGIDNLIIRGMIIDTQWGNKHLFVT